MIIGLPLTADQIASIGTGINFIRLKMGGRTFYPTNMSADNSSIQSWTIQIKNNSQGGFSEGAFAGDPAEIAWSSDNQNWLTIMKGQVDGSGAKRVEGNQTDDYLTFSIKDYAEAWGTSKDIDDTVLCGYRICDPSNPGSSIVHWLAGKMGLTADQVDCGTISQVLDLVQISGTPWSNLQKLGEAYGVSVRFTGDGKLWFHSVCETGFTEPSNEWTIDADLNNLASDSHSNAIGKISSSFLKRTCTKAESSFSTYKLLSRQQIYKCTENANSSTGYCHVEVKANSTYPEEGVMELKYKDPSTGEEFAHAIEVETPTVGITESCEIFATGELTLDYFSPDDVQGSARIRLKNSTSSAIYIKKLVLYGKPYSKQDDTKVTYELSTVPEEEKADSSVDGTFGTTSALMTTVLKRKCSIEGIRRREFSLSTWFLPQVQLGMGMQIRKAGEIISCTVASYRHSLTGKTLATLRTDLTLEEISEFVPDEDPDIIIHNPNYSLSTKGDKGDSGETPVTLYAVGSSRTSAPELSASWGSSEGEWGSSEGSWGIRVEWASEAPSVPAGFYLWSKSKLPSETVWNYVCLTGEQGEQGSPGTDAVAFSIYSDKSTYRISQRNTEDQTIIFGYSIENQTGTVAWTIDASGTVSISGSVVTVLPECTLSQFTVTATLSRDGAVVDTKTITINGVVQEDVPVYLGTFTADPAASATSVAKFIRGDFYLRTDITDNGDGTYTNTATTLFPFKYDGSAFRQITVSTDSDFSKICGAILGDIGTFIASKPGCSSPSLYSYFETILAQYIGAQKIVLLLGGLMQSTEFAEDSTGFATKGFYFNSAGVSKLYDALLTNVKIKCKDTQNKILLQTQEYEAGTGTVACSAKTRWSTDQAFSDIAEGGTGTCTYNGTSHSFKKFIPYYGDPTTHNEKRYYIYRFQYETNSDYIIPEFTVKVSGAYGALIASESWYGGNHYYSEVYKNDVLVKTASQASYGSSYDTYFAMNCVAGDRIKIKIIGTSGGSTGQEYFGLYFDGGTDDIALFDSSTITSGLMSYSWNDLVFVIPSGRYSNQTLVKGTKTYSESSNNEYASIDGWYDGFASGQKDLESSAPVINGTAVTVTSLVKSSGQITLYDSSGTTYAFSAPADTGDFASTGWYRISGSLKPVGKASALLTYTLLPTDTSNATVGSSSLKYKQGNFETVNGDTVNGSQINGNVNSQATSSSVKVYGAVFN